MKHPNTKHKQIQVAKAGKNSVQTGRDYTQTTTTRIGVWVSVTLVAALAIGASIFIRVSGENIPGIEIFMKPDTEPVLEQNRE